MFHKRIVSVLAGALALAALSPSVSGQMPPQSQTVGTGLIAGQVVDADTGKGIAGALVALVPVRRTPSGLQAVRQLGIAADSQGRFYFSGLSEGEYGMEAVFPGYTTPADTALIALKAGEHKTDVRTTLRRLSTVSGRVTDESGGPVVAADIRVLRRTTVGGRPPALVAAGIGRTDDRGEYRITNLQQGEYYICVCGKDPLPFDGQLLTTMAERPTDLLAVAARATTAGADTVQFDSPLRTTPITLYPGTTLFAQAERVRLGGGETDRTDLNISVTTVVGRRISGRVLGAPAPLHANNLRLIQEGDLPETAGVVQIPAMLVQPDGRFDFAGVPPGLYRLEATVAPGGRGGGPSGSALALIGTRSSQMAPQMAGTMSGPPAAGDAVWGATTIAVGDADVKDIVVGLQPTFSISGRLEFVGSSPPPVPQQGQRVIVQVVSELTGPLSRGGGSPAQPDQTFRIGGIVPGRYALIPSLGGPSPWVTIRRVTAGGVDVTDTLFTIDKSIPDVVITLSDVPEAVVSGRVSGPPPEGTALSAYIFPTDKRLWAAPFGAARRFRSVRVQADGSFSIPRITAGEYFVWVTDTRLEWMDVATFESFARLATRADVPETGTMTVEVRR